MQDLSIRNLGVKEQQALASSFQPAMRRRGMRNLVLSTLVVITGVVVFSIFGVERVPLAAMAAFIVAVLVSEKISYFREIRAYKSLVRAMVLRIEQLETAGPSSAAEQSTEPPEHPAGA
jgi:hypothetical protein